MKNALQFNETIHKYQITTSRNAYIIEEEDFIRPLGKGVYGTVYKAYTSNGQANKLYAIKQIFKQSSISNDKYINEIHLASKLKNSYHVTYEEDSIEDSKYIFLVTQLYDSGSLRTAIEKNLIKSELECIEYLRQICYGLREIHNLHIMHRDLKPENILLTKNIDSLYPFQYIFGITDFGISIEYNEQSQHTINAGTPFTMAPEVRNGIYDERADIYSIGCIFYEMLFHKHLFKGSTVSELSMNQDSVDVIYPSSMKLHKKSLEILEGCLQYDKEHRISSRELFDLLEVGSLYSQYKILDIGDIDENQKICLKGFTRSIHIDSTRALSTKKKAIIKLNGLSVASTREWKILTTSGCVNVCNIVHNKVHLGVLSINEKRITDVSGLISKLICSISMNFYRI